MDGYQAPLNWLSRQKESMIDLLIHWVNINSGTENLEGLDKMLLTITDELKVFNEPIEVISLESGVRVDNNGEIRKLHFGKALRVTKRPKAPIQILLCGHMDTVFPVDSPFQTAKRVDEHTLIGPGATDMKGGLIIMLKALEAFERFDKKDQIGWELIINPDEEIGSLGSEAVIRKSTKGKDIGLIFEPSFPDGFIVCERKGSTNFTIVSRGISAHAGRDFDKGRNAITNLIKLLIKVEQLNGAREGLTVNLGHIHGGGPTNIVPDLALCRCNSRMKKLEDADFLLTTVEELIAEQNRKEGVNLEFHKASYRPPKEFDTAHQHLFNDLQECSKELSQNLNWRASGGVCDGNIFAQEGLTTADTLGVIGSGIHTFDETTDLDSLTDRAQLCTLFLMKIASHAIDINRYKHTKATVGEY